jgi:hypothetical protein
MLVLVLVLVLVSTGRVLSSNREDNDGEEADTMVTTK